MVKHGADVNAQVNGADKYSGRVSYAWRDPNFTQSNEGNDCAPCRRSIPEFDSC
jgi:hypothetical protein